MANGSPAQKRRRPRRGPDTRKVIVTGLILISTSGVSSVILGMAAR
jgi:hypothetical protein